MIVKTSVKAGDWGITSNHSEAQAKGLTVRTGIKAGFNPQPDPPGDHS